MKHEEQEFEAREVQTIDAGVMQAISKSELDQRITTARAYPRSIKKFRNECLQMATLTDQVAEECIYALPRGGKTIEGPSARLAEIVASAWGNCDAGARIIEEGRDFVTAQGVFRDLERNVSITFEVRRRITNKRGQRFEADMIGVTGNAAASIALRNAVFKGIPKAFWSDIYDAARQCAIGNAETLANRRAKAIGYLQKMGATEAQILGVLGKKGVEDIGLEDLATLKGLATAIKDGDTTVEQAFASKADHPVSEAKGVAGLAARMGVEEPKTTELPKRDDTAPADAPVQLDGATIIGGMREATTDEVLQQWAGQAKGLTGQDKAEARVAYAEARKRIADLLADNDDRAEDEARKADA